MVTTKRTRKGPYRLILLLGVLFIFVVCVICVVGLIIGTTTVGSIFAPTATTYVRAGPSMNPSGILMYDVAVWNQEARHWDCRGGVYVNSTNQIPGLLEVGRYYSMGIGPTGMVTQFSPIPAPMDLSRPNCPSP